MLKTRRKPVAPRPVPKKRGSRGRSLGFQGNVGVQTGQKEKNAADILLHGGAIPGCERGGAYRAAGASGADEIVRSSILRRLKKLDCFSRSDPARGAFRPARRIRHVNNGQHRSGLDIRFSQVRNGWPNLNNPEQQPFLGLNKIPPLSNRAIACLSPVLRRRRITPHDNRRT